MLILKGEWIMNKEELINKSIEELKEIKKDLEKQLNELDNENCIKIANSIPEEEATDDLLEDLVENGNKKDDIIYQLEDVDEVIRYKESE